MEREATVLIEPHQLWALGERIRQKYPKNLTKRTILFFVRGNSRYRFVAGSMGLDRDPKISDQRIPPCLPAPVPIAGGAGRYKIFSGIRDEF